MQLGFARNTEIAFGVNAKWKLERDKCTACAVSDFEFYFSATMRRCDDACHVSTRDERIREPHLAVNEPFDPEFYLTRRPDEV